MPLLRKSKYEEYEHEKQALSTFEKRQNETILKLLSISSGHPNAHDGPSQNEAKIWRVEIDAQQALARNAELLLAAISR